MTSPDPSAARPGEVSAAGVSYAGVSYASAGVDIAAGEHAVELMKRHVARASRPEVLGGLGGFAGLFALDLARYPEPVLASSTDGVGTKIAIAQAVNKHDTIGIDLVAMVVDDLVVVGAEPLFLTDYIATGKVVPEKVAAIVAGIAEGCVQAGCALIGGETAEHPGVMAPEEYDVSGTGVGVVNADAVLGPRRMRPGDAVIALGSSGLHSNGYSLVRHVLLERGGLELTARRAEFGGRTLADELLIPTRVYAQDCLALARECEVHAFAHITGGGLAGNLARVLPPGATAYLDRATWAPGAVFDLVARTGGVGRAQMELTFNLGVGMVAVLPQAALDDALTLLAQRGVPAWVVGEVRSDGADTQRSDGGAGSVELVGSYQGPAAAWEPAV